MLSDVRKLLDRQPSGRAGRGARSRRGCSDIRTAPRACRPEATPATREQCNGRGTESRRLDEPAPVSEERFVGDFRAGHVGGTPDQHDLLPWVTENNTLPYDTPRARIRFPGADREGFEPSIRF
jgi:hypothetical protein